jgi:hypothetical protein
VNESNNDYQRESMINERQKEWKMEFEKGQFIRERADPHKASQPKQASVAKEDAVDGTDPRDINSDE